MSNNAAVDIEQDGGPTTNIRLYLRASNLPKSLTNTQPDTLARVSILSPQSGRNDFSSSSQLTPPVPPPNDGEIENDASEGVLDETEVQCDMFSLSLSLSFSHANSYNHVSMM